VTPFTALVAIGVQALGGATFLTAAVSGMGLHDLIANPGRLRPARDDGAVWAGRRFRRPTLRTI
jgi:hypothetical protein